MMAANGAVQDHGQDLEKGPDHLPLKGNSKGNLPVGCPPRGVRLFRALQKHSTLEEAAKEAGLIYLQAWKTSRIIEGKRWITITKEDNLLKFAPGPNAWQGELEVVRFGLGDLGSSFPQTPAASEKREVTDGGFGTITAFTSLLRRCLIEKGIGPSRIHGAAAFATLRAQHEAPLLNPDRIGHLKSWRAKGAQHALYEVLDGDHNYQVKLTGSVLQYNLPEETVPSTPEALRAWVPAAAIAGRRKLDWAARALGLVIVGDVRIGGVNKKGVHVAIPGLAKLLGLTGRVTGQAIGIWVDCSKGYPEVEFELQTAIVLLSIPAVLNEHDKRLDLAEEKNRALQKRVAELEARFNQAQEAPHP